ncbi:hypothetical protein [Actinomadura atramentaria]|uniref:hypothetical protein n=1 Tax=Actinomadura atramentaria TaxID=1990 RepID=UPI00037A689C|nr:hypothetical protein [Actinomadura atramentaria]
MGGAALAYLRDRFPPSHAVALATVAFLTYLLCGRAGADASTAGWPALTASAACTLLFLQTRLLDDAEARSSGRRGLLLGLAATTAAVLALAAAPDSGPRVLASVLLPTAVMAVGAAVLTRWPDALLFGRVPLCDGGPALALLSVAVRWEAATGGSLSAGSTFLVVAEPLLLYEIWKESRRIGRVSPGEPPEAAARRWRRDRLRIGGFALAHAAVVVALAHAAGLSAAYAAYGCALSLALAAGALLRLRDAGRPRWCGLPFPGLMVLGLLLELAASDPPF